MHRSVLTLLSLPGGFVTAAGLVAASVLASSALLAPALAQPASAPERGGASIPFATVAQALAALKARDGDSVTVMSADGWITVDEPSAAARWSFTPSGHYAYPAVVKRVIKRSPAGAAEVETASLCESDKASCDKLLAEFQVLDERIRQAIQARGRRAPPPPSMPAAPPMPVPAAPAAPSASAPAAS